MSKRRASGSAGKSQTQRPHRRGRFRAFLKWGLVVGLVLALVGMLGVFWFYKVTPIPDPNEEFLTETTQVYWADGETELGSFAIQDRDSIPLSEMPQHFQDAVVSAEDRSFWTNKGIDPRGIVRAAWNNFRGGPTQGASTITQQYVKILYLTSERKLSRKAKEAVVSVKLQREQSKKEILEGYLNTIYYGRGAYGVQAAARAYFGKPASELNLRESAVLASVINNPTKFDPTGDKESRQALKGRAQYVLNGMVTMGTLDEAKAEQAGRKLPKFPKRAADSRYGGQKGHMLELVRRELIEIGYTEEEINGGGLRVTTTFTPEAMAAAEEGVREVRPTQGYTGQRLSDKNLHVGVATVEVGTGALRGFYGGQDYLDSQINWAATGGMAGSTMKAVTLATAITEGFSLKDTFEGNSPYVFPDGLEIENQGEGTGSNFGSSISMITATQKSANTAFVDMTASMEDGPEKVWEMGRRMGIPGEQPSDKFPGIPKRTPDFLPEDVLITLGKARVSPINMANAYATIANGGERANVHVVQSVHLAGGEEDYVNKVGGQKAIDEDIAADVSFALQENVRAGTATTAKEIGRPAAAKTGTATKEGKGEETDVSSSWFAGYTPQLATAVMYVRGDGDDPLNEWLPTFYGGEYPASTWAAVMERAMEGMEVEEFPEPVYVDGEAPSEGHEPYTPPPTTRHTPKPTKTPKPTTSSPTPTTSSPPTDPPTSDPPVTEEPSPSISLPTDTGSPSDGGAGAGGGGAPGDGAGTQPRAMPQMATPTAYAWW